MFRVILAKYKDGVRPMSAFLTPLEVRIETLREICPKKIDEEVEFIELRPIDLTVVPDENAIIRFVMRELKS